MLAMAGDEGLEPSYLDLETSVLAAGRISRKLMAELTGIEPVPADRQSAILPIDHSSGSLPWTRTTISAFRAQRPAIGRRGNFKIVKELVAGERFERRSRTYEARALPTELHQRKLSFKNLEVAGRIALPMICFAGRRLAVLATPPHNLERKAGLEPALSTLATSRLGH